MPPLLLLYHKPSKQQSVEIKNPPADSITPTITAKPSSSFSPSTLTGFAVSGASRDPAFGRNEAIIGIPGVTTLVAVAPPGTDVAVGQQVGTGMQDGPTLVNPGKYEIPAGKCWNLTLGFIVCCIIS
jgi:hypothetical protein